MGCSKVVLSEKFTVLRTYIKKQINKQKIEISKKQPNDTHLEVFEK